MQEEPQDKLYQDGMKVRRKILGNAHVDRAQARTTDVNREFQELIIRYGWGEVWTREGLPRATRSLINIAMLTALNRPHELAVHVRGAITNGVTESEIQEVLLQTAIYVGVPASLESFRIAEATINEIKASA